MGGSQNFLLFYLQLLYLFFLLTGVGNIVGQAQQSCWFELLEPSYNSIIILGGGTEVDDICSQHLLPPTPHTSAHWHFYINSFILSRKNHPCWLIGSGVPLDSCGLCAGQDGKRWCLLSALDENDLAALKIIICVITETSWKIQGQGTILHSWLRWHSFSKLDTVDIQGWIIHFCGSLSC